MPGLVQKSQLVRETGFEPAWWAHRTLPRRLRLPISPLPHLPFPIRNLFDDEDKALGRAICALTCG